MVMKDRTYTKRMSSAPGTTPSVATALGRAMMPAGHTSYMLKLCHIFEYFCHMAMIAKHTQKAIARGMQC